MNVTLSVETAGQRADQFLAARLDGLTRSAAQKLLEEGHVLCQGRPLKKNDRLKPGDQVAVCIPDPTPVELLPQDIPLEVVYEDEDVIVVNKPVGMVVHPAASFRHIAVQSGASITGISLLPPHDHLGEVIGPLLPSGNDNAQVLKSLMKLAHQVLDHHPINEQRRAEGKRPANGVWFWAEGSAVALESFWEKYHKTGTVISAVPLCFGIARLSGLDIREVPGSTGELDTNYEGKVAAALEELRSGKDFVAVHVEAPDECTHNGDLPGKLQAIEWLDSRVVGPLTQALAEEGTDYRLLILSDHKTLTATRGHDADPVPYLLYDSRKDTGLGLPYCEESGQKGPAYPAGAPVLMKKLFAL